MEKKDALRRWQNLEPDQPILPHFTPIAADARGSTFGACGIRISGNPEFIDAVLSRLKDLLAAEAGSTRLNLSRQPVKPVSITSGDSVVDKKWNNADTDAETCYIQIRERTARTRQRKVREHSNPLPGIEELPLDGENQPSAASETKAPTATTPKAEKPVKPKQEPIVHANIGSLSTGEVLWDDDDDDKTEEEGKTWQKK